jgi:hypothetical protein
MQFAAEAGQAASAVPAAAGLQTPCPFKLQCVQLPHDEVWQQTPSTQ